MQMASGKLFHLHASDTELPPATKKRKTAAVVERPRGVASQFRQTDISDISEVSRIFEGKEFCVVNGTKGLEKAEAERKIAEVLYGEMIKLVSCLFVCLFVCFLAWRKLCSKSRSKHFLCFGSQVNSPRKQHHQVRTLQFINQCDMFVLCLCRTGLYDVVKIDWLVNCLVRPNFRILSDSFLLSG